MSTVARTADYTLPKSLGTPIYDYPFNDFGGTAVLVTQRYKQDRASFLTDMAAATYAPGATTYPGITNCYVLETSVPSPTDTGLFEFTRLWGTKPGNRTDYESLAFRFPGYDVVGVAREPFTLSVAVKIDYAYYLVGSFGGADVATADLITLAAPYAFGGNYLTDDTSPTQTAYAATVTTGGYTLVVDVALKQWHGCIYERITRTIVPM